MRILPKFTLLDENKRTQLITPNIEGKITAQLVKGKRKGSLSTALFIIFDCGLRPIEIVSLRISDVNLTRDSIHIHKSKRRAGERLVPMIDRVKELLIRQIGRRTDGWVFLLLAIRVNPSSATL